MLHNRSNKRSMEIKKFLKAVVTQISMLLQKSPLMTHLSLLQAQQLKLGGSSFPELLSLGNAMSFDNRLEDFFGDTSNAVRLIEMEADLSNMETPIQVSPTPTLRIHKDHPKSQIISPIDTPVQTRQKTKNVDEQSLIATIHQKTNLDLLQYCLFSCFLSQEEPKKIVDALKDPSWVEAMQQEYLQFKIQNEEGIDYEEVFAPILRIEVIRLFLAYASYMGFKVYQMDVRSAFLYWIINEEVYVMQPPGFPDPEFPHRVYKAEKAMYGLHQAPRAWYGTLSKYLLDNGFQRGTIEQTLFIRKHKGEFLLVQVITSITKENGIFLSQDKYVGDILKKIRYTDIRAAKTPMDRENPWGKDGTGKDVELHLYRSMIGSLMYLTASRPDIMYLKGNPKLGLRYPKESPFDLVAYSNSDYGGAHQDRKSTTKGCQFLGRRLISWKCKKQTIMATSTTEAEYVAAASGCGQVPSIQNQLLDYGTVELFASMLVPQGEGSEHPSEPHHTPSDQDKPIHHEQITQSPQHAQITSHEQTISQEPTIPSQSHSVITTPRKLTRGTIQISQSKVPSSGADETTFPIGDVRYREAFPTDTILDAGQYATKTSGIDGYLYQYLKATLTYRGKGSESRHGNLSFEGQDQGEDLLDRDKSADKGSDNTDEMANVLGTLGAANILANRGLRSVFTTASLSVATARTGVSPTVAIASISFLTTLIFTTTSVATPTTRVTRSSRGVVIGSSSPISANIPSISKKDKGKGKMTKPEQPSKEKVLEQLLIQLARDLEAKFAQKDQIIREQAERDSKIARIHAKKELEMMISELDRSNEMVAKYLSEYEQAEAGLSHDEKVELINELLMYQRYLAQIKKYQAQQNKPAKKTKRRSFYMSILRSNDGWKAKDFKGITFEKIEEKFIPVWEKMQDFVPMNSMLESERLKRPGIQLDKERFKKLKTTEASGTEPTQEQQSEEPKELSEEKLKKMIELFPVE
nr:hypothetical protein [Tanacetum cinerariifolium]